MTELLCESSSSECDFRLHDPFTTDTVRSVRVGLPVSTTYLADTESVTVGSTAAIDVDSESQSPMCGTRFRKHN